MLLLSPTHLCQLHSNQTVVAGPFGQPARAKREDEPAHSPSHSPPWLGCGQGHAGLSMELLRVGQPSFIPGEGHTSSLRTPLKPQRIFPNLCEGMLEAVFKETFPVDYIVTQ